MDIQINMINLLFSTLIGTIACGLIVKIERKQGIAYDIKDIIAPPIALSAGLTILIMLMFYSNPYTSPSDLGQIALRMAHPFQALVNGFGYAFQCTGYLLCAIYGFKKFWPK